MNLKTLLIAGCACAMATSAFAQGMGGQNMDANGDGKIDKAEYGASAKAMLDRLDTDKDGKISAAEQSAMGGGGGGGGGGFMAGADADKDGSITLAELQAQRATRFDQMDTNKDGSLSQEERAAGRQRPAQ
jgi:hypothetical protein